MSVVVRAAVAGDLAEVVALERATAEAPHWREAEYAEIVEGGAGWVRRCLLVAEADGGVAGFAVGKVAGGVGEIESVAVAEVARRRGVGRALCGAAVRWGKAEGAVVMDLEVRAGSAGAIALYAGLGFREVGRRREYYQDPVEDALLMEMKLAGC